MLPDSNAELVELVLLCWTSNDRFRRVDVFNLSTKVVSPFCGRTREKKQVRSSNETEKGRYEGRRRDERFCEMNKAKSVSKVEIASGSDGGDELTSRAVNPTLEARGPSTGAGGASFCFLSDA